MRVGNRELSQRIFKLYKEKMFSLQFKLHDRVGWDDGILLIFTSKHGIISLKQRRGHIGKSR